MHWMLLLFAALCILFGIGAIYVTRRFHQFTWVQKISERNQLLSWIVSLLPLAVSACFGIINVYAAAIVLLHLVVIWLLCDCIAYFVKKICKKDFRRYYAGICAMLLTALYLSYGWFCAHHVYETDHIIKTDKALGRESLRIAVIGDAHIGITLDRHNIAETMEKVRKANPDVIIIAGDFVDDDTTKTDMLAACQALGSLHTTFGTYFAFGNHDEGYFQYRDFTSAELRSALRENDITILEDESVLIDDSFYIIGRKDRSVRDRADIASITQDLDDSRYQIVIDHQPNDYAEEAAAGVDLVVSGHTHGGHIFPAGYLGLLIGANDRVYGMETRGQTTFAVTSGISGWAIPFKTGCISEFMVIDIQQN